MIQLEADLFVFTTTILQHCFFIILSSHYGHVVRTVYCVMSVETQRHVLSCYQTEEMKIIYS